MTSTWSLACGTTPTATGTATTRYAAFLAGCEAIHRAYADLPADAVDPDGRPPSARLSIDGDEPVIVRAQRDAAGDHHPHQLVGVLEQLREMWVLSHLGEHGLIADVVAHPTAHPTVHSGDAQAGAR